GVVVLDPDPRAVARMEAHGDVADREQIRSAGAPARVGDDPAGDLEAGLRRQLGVGHRADADQQLVGLDHRSVAGAQLQTRGRLAQRLDRRAGAYLDAVLGVDAEHRVADLGPERTGER